MTPFKKFDKSFVLETCDHCNERNTFCYTVNKLLTDLTQYLYKTHAWRGFLLLSKRSRLVAVERSIDSDEVLEMYAAIAERYGNVESRLQFVDEVSNGCGQCAVVARAGDLGVEVVAEGQGQLGGTVE